MKQTFQLFQPRNLLVTAIVIATLFSCSGSDKAETEPVDVVIEIVSDIPGTDLLTLNPPDTVRVYPGKKVTWKIASTASNVKFVGIAKKKGSKQIFLLWRQPSSNPSQQCEGTVDLFRYDALYDYSIIWKDSVGKKHSFDPKIAVKPSAFHFTKLIVGLIVLLLGGGTFIFMRKKK